VEIYFKGEFSMSSELIDVLNENGV
jgi:hypothetical protein